MYFDRRQFAALLLWESLDFYPGATFVSQIIQPFLNFVSSYTDDKIASQWAVALQATVQGFISLEELEKIIIWIAAHSDSKTAPKWELFSEVITFDTANQIRKKILADAEHLPEWAQTACQIWRS